jgi:hypothetical protein
MSRLGDAIRAHEHTLTRLATVYADEITRGGGEDRQVIEALELLRHQAHHWVDEAVDAEELRRPPGGNAWRARRYRELQVPTA